MSVVAHRLVGVSSACRNDLAAIKEGVRNRDRLIEKAARIVAQIENIALELVSWNIGLELLDRVDDAISGLFVELGYADIADVVAFLMRANRLDLDHRPGQLDVLRLLFVAAQDLQDHARVRRAAHLVDSLIEGQTLHRLAIDGGDDVAGKNPRRGTPAYRRSGSRP